MAAGACDYCGFPQAESAIGSVKCALPVATRTKMTSSAHIIDVIEQAMRSHDGKAALWLQRIIILQNAPEGRPHARALAVARAYLEDLAGQPPGADAGQG